MNATDLAPSRLAVARDRARQVIAGLRAIDDMAIVAAGTQPHVVCGLTGHQRTLREALDQVNATDGPTSVGAAVALARGLVGDAANARIVVVSDGCFPDSEELLKAPDVDFLVTGSRVGNIGITRFQVRRSLLDPVGFQILTEITNHSEESAECRLELELGNQVIDVVPLNLAPGQTFRKTFDQTSQSGGRLVARLNSADALAADNTAQALLPGREQIPVLLVSAGNLFLEKVFEANSLVRLQVATELPEVIPQRTLVVLHRQVPEKLPPGSIFVVDPDGSCDLWKAGDELESAVAVKQDKGSLLLANIRLDNVLLPAARKLEFNSPPQVLVSAQTGDPLLAAVERPEGKILVLTTNLDQGDLPLRIAFPILAANALGWFSGLTGDLQEALPAGATFTYTLPANQPTDDARLELSPPHGPARPIALEGKETTLGPFDQCGVWSVGWKLPERVTGAQRRGGEAEPAAPAPLLEIACNLSNPAESDLRTPEAVLTHPAPRTLAAGIFTRPVWFLLLVLALVLTAVEWFLYHRRWIS